MTYPLLPYSQLVLEMMREIPGVYDNPVLFRIDSSEVDVDRLEDSLRKALRNHPVFSMNLDSSGHHPYEPSDELQGPYHSAKVTREGDGVLLSFSFNRILGDMTSLTILADDFSRAYRGLDLEPDRYVDYLKSYWERRNSLRNESSRKWLEDEFGAISCPVRPHTDSPVESTPFRYSAILMDSIPFPETVLRREHITPSAFVSLCTALAIMDYEDSDSAALTWAYAGRDTLDEQRIFGSLHRDVPFVVRRSSSPDEMFRQVRNQFRSGIAHSDYPYTLTPPNTEVWNYAVNVLHQPDLTKVFSSFPFHLEMLDPSENAPRVAYSLLDVEFSDVTGNSVDLLYRYSAAHYRRESIVRFANLVSANAQWLSGGHRRATRHLEELLSSDKELENLLRRSITVASENCPDNRMNPVRNLEELYLFLDRFLRCRPWESLGLGEEMSLFRRIDQSTGYFLYLFDQPLPELEDRGYLYPSVQFIPAVAQWIKEFNNEWREYLDSPSSWDSGCLDIVSSDPVFGMDRGWYESPENWRCWNEFFSRKLSGKAARPVSGLPVAAPADGILQEIWDIADDNRLLVPDGVSLKTASLRSVEDLLGESRYRGCFAGGLFVHQTLDFYDYHRFHSPVEGQVLEVLRIDGISGSGGVVVWNSVRGRYEYSNPGEPGFQMIETRGVIVIDAGALGIVAVVAVGMAQVCSVNWTPGIKVGSTLHKGGELGFFLCGGSDVVVLFQKNVKLQLVSTPGRHLLMGEGIMERI